MIYIKRKLEEKLLHALSRDKSVLLLGSRQTGKTTLIKRLQFDWMFTLSIPEVRQRYERQPSALIAEVEAMSAKKTLPLIVIDEIQKVPDLLDVVQYLIDEKKAKFVLTGSSARKLKKDATLNLLPGRVVVLKLDPITLSEFEPGVPLLDDLLIYGSLPGILSVPIHEDKDTDLKSYVITYLEEEIRSEALVRNITSFSRFLELAASESGNILNFSKLSQEIGVAHTTIASYYQILEDCLIATRIDPFIKTKTRRKLIKTPKYLFFDLGLRRVAAGEGTKLPDKHCGWLFEQFVGLELCRHAHFSREPIKIHFWRDLNGQEVDWIIEQSQQLIPVEVKWTDTPNLKDARHLQLFLQEYPEASNAYIVCRAPRPMKLAENIYAIPWQDIPKLFEAHL